MKDETDEIIVGDEDEELTDEELVQFANIVDEQELLATPYRIMLMFTGADIGDDTLDGVIEFLIAEGEARGLFHQFSMGTEMDLIEVDQKSKLWEIITGREVS